MSRELYKFPLEETMLKYATSDREYVVKADGFDVILVADMRNYFNFKKQIAIIENDSDFINAIILNSKHENEFIKTFCKITMNGITDV